MGGAYKKAAEEGWPCTAAQRDSLDHAHPLGARKDFGALKSCRLEALPTERAVPVTD